MAPLDLWAMLPLVAGIIATGAVAGLLSGLLGVGGGIVVVPVLFWVFSALDYAPGLTMQMAVATSLVTVAVTALSSARAHYKRGAVDMRLVRVWAPWMVLGAVSGGTMAGIVSGRALLLVFGVIALLVAWNMALPKTRVLAKNLPTRTGAQPLMAASVGVISAMMGIGSGTLGVPLLTAFSIPVRMAVGTSAALGLAIGLPAAAAMVVAGLGVDGRPPFSVGYTNMAAVALILPLSVYLAPFGARIAHAVDPIWIKRAFSLFLLITACRMIWSALS